MNKYIDIIYKKNIHYYNSKIEIGISESIFYKNIDNVRDTVNNKNSYNYNDFLNIFARLLLVKKISPDRIKQYIYKFDRPTQSSCDYKYKYNITCDEMFNFCNTFYNTDETNFVNFFMNIDKNNKIYKSFFETEKCACMLHNIYEMIMYIDQTLIDEIYMENEDAYWNGLCDNFINKDKLSYGEYYVNDNIISVINDGKCVKAGYFQTLYKNLIMQNQITFTGKHTYCSSSIAGSNPILNNLPPNIGFGDIIQLVFVHNCLNNKFEIILECFNAQYGGSSEKILKKDNLKKLIHKDLDDMSLKLSKTPNEIISLFGLSFYDYYLENMFNRKIFKLNEIAVRNLTLLWDIIKNCSYLYNIYDNDFLRQKLIKGEFSDNLINFKFSFEEQYNYFSSIINNYTKNKLNIINEDDNLEDNLYDCVKLIHTFELNNNIIIDLTDDKFRKKILNNKTVYEVDKKNILNISESLNNTTTKLLVESKSRLNEYLHCCWGNTNVSHKAGDSCCIIVAPLKLQKGRILRINPPDTIILDYLKFNSDSYLFINETQVNEWKIIFESADIPYNINELKKNKMTNINDLKITRLKNINIICVPSFLTSFDIVNKYIDVLYDANIHHFKSRIKIIDEHILYENVNIIRDAANNKIIYSSHNILNVFADILLIKKIYYNY